MACLVHLHFIGVEPDFVSDFEFSWWLAVSSHLFLASSKHCFGIRSYFFELIKMFVNCGDVAAIAGEDSEVGLVAVYDLER